MFERNRIKAIKESETFVLLLIGNQKLSNAQVSNDLKVLFGKIVEKTNEKQHNQYENIIGSNCCVVFPANN